METLYIDVFFLINFTIDILSAHFSAKFLHIKTSVPRLVFIGVIGALAAVSDIFLPSVFGLKIINSIGFLSLMTLIISKKCGIGRRIKFAISFLIFCMTLAGIVYFCYSMLDRLLAGYPSEELAEAENRGALLFSLIILIAIGVFKLLIMLFSGAKGVKNVRIRIEIEGRTAETDALVDSGNLVKDPMNMYPVLFVKQSFARTFLPQNILELSSLDKLERSYKKRVRLIPVTRSGSTHVLTGVRVDRVSLISKRGIDDVNVSIAIDKEGGSYGGYEALLPSAVVDDVL